ncbi:alpha/beta fold hydrolase [Pseudomaricurvus sp. HS19]|uniref:alpha/beta fold hydrolase n=1 Tax=Pseudomaricurvus sp. HS19 TaxID=2692626 RepID=UPI00136CE70C|nr:alpha/beta hydrolase [Pseudomaricurvus sp. HS19]MYM64402.1 alpha/beta fold hydrolase [Pseudomaricurvus sp. HS19]
MTTDSPVAGATPFVPPADAPSWFLDNLNHPGESRYATVNGKRVHFLCWNWQRTELPVLVLVHGFCGNAHWWAYLAPFFTDRYRVIAIDLPAMGDSDHLDRYEDDNCYADGIVGVIREHNLGPVTIAGHSFGGVQTIRALALAPELFRQGLIIDSIVRFPPEETIPLIKPRDHLRSRATQLECQREFRLAPPQPDYIEALVQYIGYHSCRVTAEGWSWKFDPRAINVGELRQLELLQKVTTPISTIYGELSLFSDNGRPQRILESFLCGERLIVIPKAHHHLMTDHPLQLVEAMNALLHPL